MRGSAAATTLLRLALSGCAGALGAFAPAAFAFDLAHIHHFGALPLASQEARPGAFGITLGRPLAEAGGKVTSKDDEDSDDAATYYYLTPPAPDPLFSWYRVIVGPDGIVLGIGAGTEEHCDAKAALITGRYKSRWGDPGLASEPLQPRQDANLDVAWIFPGLKPSRDADARQGLFLMGESTKGGCFLEYMLGDASLIGEAPAAADQSPAAMKMK